MEKKFLILLFFFPLFLLALSSISAVCGPTLDDCDVVITNDTDPICMVPGNYTYAINVSEFYNWSDGALTHHVSSCDVDYRLDTLQRVNATTIYRPKVSMDSEDYFYGLSYNDSFWKTYTYGEIVVFQTGAHEVSNQTLGGFDLDHLDSGEWDTCAGGTNSESWDYFQLYQMDDCELPSSPPAESLTDGLVAYYPLNASGGTTVLDYSGNDIHGTAVNGDTADWDTAVVGNGWWPDGDASTEVINVSDIMTELDGVSALTVSMWLNLGKTKDDSAFCFGEGAGAGQLNLYPWSTGAFYGVGRGICNAGSYEDWGNGLTYTEDIWYHVVVVQNTTGIHFYSNGTLQDTQSCDSTGTFDGTTIPLAYFGNREGYSDYFEGGFDEVAIWNRTLNQTEITSLFNADGVPLATASWYCGDTTCNTNETCGNCATDCGACVYNATQVEDLDDITLSFADLNYTNLSKYFEDWYDLCLVFDEPFDDNQSVLCTGYGTVNTDYWEIYLGTVGEYSNLTTTSYYKNDTVVVDVFACSNESIDTWCPVSGFPGTCNISRFYTDGSCISDNYTLTILDYWTPEVNVTATIDAITYLEIGNYTQFSLSTYFQNEINYSVTFEEIINSTNYTMSCTLGSPSHQLYNGTLDISLECDDFGWLNISNYNLTATDDSVIFSVTATNTNNSETQGFWITGNSSGQPWSTTTEMFNFTSLSDMFIEIEDDNTRHFIAWVVIIAILVTLIIFVGIPLRFNAFSLFVIGLGTLLTTLGLAIIGYGEWSYFVIPLVLVIAYFVLKSFMGGGGD